MTGIRNRTLRPINTLSHIIISGALRLVGVRTNGGKIILFSVDAERSSIQAATG